MSSRLLSRSDDLQRLVAEGYEIGFKSHMLFVLVPYVTSDASVAWGHLVTPIDVEVDQTGRPSDHTVRFVGESGAAGDLPCSSDGGPLSDVINDNNPTPIAEGVISSCGFSHKPTSGQYEDYFEKITSYVEILLDEVHGIDSSIDPRTFGPISVDEEDSVHRYFDSATSRAKIGAVSARTATQRVGIIGVGGTGAYILDAVAKTHAAEIHIFDPDVFETHNAFRSPGAAGLEELRDRPLKVDYHRATFDRMHRRITAHPEAVTAANAEDLQDLTFVFVAIDAGPAKRDIIEKLIAMGIPFVDSGMGVDQMDDALGGMIRTTRPEVGRIEQEWLDETFSFAADADDDYDQNIQIAELNMMAASLSVIAWKKHIGFYRDFGREIESIYIIDGNRISNEAGPDGD